MAEDNKKPEIKKPKFNAYWIYIGVFLLIVGFQFFGGNSWTQPNKTTQTQFEEFLIAGDVEEIKIVTEGRLKYFLLPMRRQRRYTTKIKVVAF